MADHQNFKNLEKNNQLKKICQNHNLTEFASFIKLNKKIEIFNLNSNLIHICENISPNKYEMLGLFITNKSIMKNIDIYNVLIDLIMANNLQDIKKLIHLIDSENNEFQKLILHCCEADKIEILQYFLQEKVNTDTLEKCVIKTCENGYLHILKYLFENYDLNIHQNYDLALRKAGTNNHIHIVKFLLTDKSLKENANPHAVNDDLYITAIMKQNKDLLNYLDNEYKILKTDLIINYEKYYQETYKKIY